MEPISLPLYHQATFQLLDEKPIISTASLDALHHFEQTHELLLPGAVQAWYALEQAPALLSRYPPVGLMRSASLCLRQAVANANTFVQPNLPLSPSIQNPKSKIQNLPHSQLSTHANPSSPACFCYSCWPIRI